MAGASASKVNVTLTNYARGISQDRASRLAEFLAPTVPTGVASGQYKQFSDKDAFQVYDTARGIGGKRRRIDFSAEDPAFNCQPQGLEISIDDHERDLAGDTDPLGLEQAKIDVLVTDAILGHEDKVIAAAKAGLSAVGGKGVWSNASVDPIDEINEQIVAISDSIGRLPNRIVMSIGTMRVLMQHPLIIARMPGAQMAVVNAGNLPGMLINPQMDIRVGVLAKDSARTGKAASKSNIVGAEMFIFYASDNPTTYDPSFMKTFMTRRGGVEQVRSYRDEGCNSDIFALDWSEHIAVVSSIAGRRITIS